MQRLGRAGRELGGRDELHVERPHRRGALVVAKITHQGGAKVTGQADGAADGCAYRELRSSVAMMQATDHGLHNDATKPFDWSADRRILG